MYVNSCGRGSGDSRAVCRVGQYGGVPLPAYDIWRVIVVKIDDDAKSKAQAWGGVPPPDYLF